MFITRSEIKRIGRIRKLKKSNTIKVGMGVMARRLISRKENMNTNVPSGVIELDEDVYNSIIRFLLMRI